MDILLKRLNLRRQRPNYEIEVSSESDYSDGDWSNKLQLKLLIIY